MLYGSETWAVKEEDLERLDRNDTYENDSLDV